LRGVACQSSQTNERQTEAAGNIRESLFDLHRRAEDAGYGMVAYFLHLAIIEANHLAGDDNVVEMQSKK
jgi:hypothetical protein